VNKDAWDIVGSLSPGEIVTSVGKTADCDGLTWTEIDSPKQGWVAMTSPDGETLIEKISDSLNLISPVSRGIPVTQEFGEHPEFYSKISGYPVPLRGHNGRDYGTPIGSPIYAVADGQVLKAEFDSTGFGNMIRLVHSFGETLYAHCLTLYVTSGQFVQQGEQIALSGDSGMGSGPHLHFGLRIYPADRADGWGGYVDPRGYFND
jgi:murein DD-endopeptidase MepM/ murein hydrolase activator NlpD